MKEVQSGESVKKATPKQIRKERLRLAREEERGAREGLEPINDAELERLARQARKCFSLSQEEKGWIGCYCH